MVGTLIAYGTSALTAAGVSAATAAAISTFAVNFALSTIVTRVFSDNPERQQDMGVRQQVPPSAVNAVPIVYGNAYMGGTFVDAVLTTDQKTMYYVMAISSISPDGQFTFDTTDMYYGDRKIAFDSTDLTKVVSLTDEAGNADTKISGNLYINLYSSDAAGTITPLNGAAAPSTVMGGSDIAVAQRWTGTRQMNGLGFAIVKLVYNRDAGTTQLSPITFKVAHTLRGTGVAKPGDVWYDYITNSVYGGAVDPSFVDSTSRTTLNAYSDALITFTNSSGSPSTQPRYRINGVLDAGESVLSNIDRIMSACDSWMTYNAALGQWSVVVNKPETAEFAFTDNNIIGDIRVSATDITSSINQVEARFPFKENRDQANFINIETPSGLLYPNEPINKYSITYDLVNDSVQAHYLANRLLEQAREDLIVSFNTTYFGIQVDAGDVVSLTNSDYGWNAKLFRVMKVNEASLPDGSLGARLELNEYNAQVYDDQTINQFAPVPNSGLTSPIYFSALSAPTVSASRPSASIPSFDIEVTIPTTGRVTYGELFYTTNPSDNSSWKLIASATTTTGEPVTPGATYTFANQVLPTGSYYFSYVVGNNDASSARSPASSLFNWTPVGQEGPTGPAGATGPAGSTGDTGPRNAQVYFFFGSPRSTAPPAPTLAQVAYDFSTNTPSTTAPNWDSVFNPSSVGTTTANNKYWAVRVIFQEITYGGAYTETISSVFNWQNMDGLVTFTNLSAGLGPLGTNTTYIDGGTITTNTLFVDRIRNNTSGVFNTFVTFGLGTGSAVGGYNGGGAFTSSNINYNGLLAANTAGGNGIGAGTTATNTIGAAVVGVGYGSSGFSLFRTLGALGNGEEGGSFQHGGTNNLQTATAADIRLARYTGGVAYAFYIVTGAAYPFTAGHDGLQLLTEQQPEVGDIMVDVQLIAADNINDSITQMTPSTTANQKGAIGVFVGVAGSDFVPASLGHYVAGPKGVMNIFVFKPEYENIYETYRPIAINAIGEGKINVCGQGGDIQIGDLIACSDMAGKGMKQSDDVFHSYTVAKARENVTFSSPTEVKQIACIYMGG